MASREQTRARVAELQDSTDYKPDAAAPTDVGEASDVDTVAAQLTLGSRQADAITRALSRLDSGSYGRCEACGERIATARLQALPFATRCRACQEEYESTRRRRRH